MVALDERKREVAIGNRVLAHIGLCSGVTVALGHVSARVPEARDRFIVKGRGYEVDAIPAMRGEDMVVCDLEGNLVEGPRGATQCFEVKIHSSIYQRFPDIDSVVHVHPRHTVLMTVLGSRLVPMCNEGNQLVRRPIPTWPHSRLVASDADGQEVASLLGGGRAVLLLGHGAVTAGASISESISTMLQLEEQARLNYLALAAVGPDHPHIPDELLDEAGNAPGLWELPHFQSSMPGGDTDSSLGFGRSRSGPYTYWASLVSDGV